MPPKVTRYHRQDAISYALGGFAVFELLQNRPELAEWVCVHPSYRGSRVEIAALCAASNIPLFEEERPFRVLSPKGNTYLLAAFRKGSPPLAMGERHIVLVNPADMGNFGAILRTAIGFGWKNAAIVGGGMDEWNPKAVRASMGAVFHANMQRFACLDDYRSQAGERELFLFMLDGAENLNSVSFPDCRPYSLVFGNEAAGLPSQYRKLGRSVRIAHSGEIDSLNLSIAAGIALYCSSIDRTV